MPEYTLRFKRYRLCSFPHASFDHVPEYAVPDLVGRTSARIILVLRTYAIWRQDKRVGIPLALGTVGQTVIWSQCEPDRQISPLEPLTDHPNIVMRFSSSRWDPVQGLCLRLATVPSTIVIAYCSYSRSLFA